jgi:hypothetical protein
VLLGKGALIFWNGISPGGDEEFLSWHVSEHIPERVGVPGFLRGRRYVAHNGNPRYFNFYETETPEVLHSPVYRERLDHPTAWTTKVIATFVDTSRTICRVVHTQGIGEGAWMQTIRFSFPKVRETCIAALIDLLKALPSRSPLVGAHLLEGTVPEAKPTRELELRGRPDEQIDGVILVESADQATIEALADRALANTTLAATGAGTLLRGTYQLQYSLTADPSSHAQCLSL